MVPRVGERVGPYEILGRLGSGGMGLVYSAWDVRLQRDVAIKLLREEYLNPGMRSRFLQEARAASRLNHPNICTVFDIGEQQGDPFLVMELLKGETVRARITRASLSLDDTVRVATEVADALVVAHAQGVVHRDIKPANIMLVPKTGGGIQSKVLDFGLAKVDTGVPGESSFDLTSTGTTVGTVSYMSPEQARGESLDARSDLFSLGVVLYEMATGCLPFLGATSALVFVQLLSHRPEPARELNPEIPKDFERIIVKLLEKNRSDRFQTARDLLQALERLENKRLPSVKGLWGKTGTRTNRDAKASQAQKDSSSRPKDASPRSPTGSGESVLRPVKRITTGELQKSLRDSSPPAATPPIAGPPPPDTPATAMPTPTMYPIGSKAFPKIGTGASPLPRAETQGTMGTAQSGSGSYSPLPSAPSPAPSSTASPTVRGANSPSPSVRGTVPTDDGWAPRFAAVSRDQPRPKPPRRFEPIEIAAAPRQPRHTEASAEPFAKDRHQLGRKAIWAAASAAIVLFAAVGLGWFFLLRHAVVQADTPAALVLGRLNNRTDDAALGNTILAGVRFELQQSASLSVRSNGGYEAALHLAGVADISNPTLDSACRAAHVAGAGMILFSELASSGDGYTITMRGYNTVSGTRSFEVTQAAASREQIPDALDRLAIDVRSSLGEGGDSISRNSVPLAREATANPEALEAYAAGDRLARNGHYMDGIAAFEHAVTLDPHFPQAYMRLAELYRRQHAQVAAAAAAENAQRSASAASMRTQLLAQAAQALESAGDLPHAADLLLQVTHAFPGDIDAQRQLAQAQRLEGKYTDALASAEAALRLSPLDTDAAGIAELAMVALDRVEAAAQLEQQSRNAGMPHPGITILIDFLHSETGNSSPPQIPASVDRLSTYAYAASVLDAQGQTAAGLATWQGIVDRAATDPALVSAVSYALAQAALNRALVADCTTSQGLLHRAKGMPADPYTLQALGIAGALCGDLDLTRSSLAALSSNFSRDFVAGHTYIPNLSALVAWKSGDASGALNMLKAARQNDLFSLTPFLRGLILLSTHQNQLAILEFQAMLLHRGATTLTDAVAYPVSQLNLARAYLDSGDKVNSTNGYSEFLAEWSKADPTHPMIVEAQSHTH